MVIGECCLNDAVAIALSFSVENFKDHTGDAEEGNFSVSHEALNAFLTFLALFFFSLLIGFIVGVLFSILYRYLSMFLIPWIEIGIFILAAYFPYILAEGLECSGLLAILMNAIIMQYYCLHSLSEEARVSI